MKYKSSTRGYRRVQEGIGAVNDQYMAVIQWQILIEEAVIVIL